MSSQQDNEVDGTSIYNYYNNTKGKVKTHHIVFVLFILAMVLLFHFRHKLAAAHDRYRTRRRMRFSGLDSDGTGFEDDLESGLSSNTFDIGENIANQDQRHGLLQNSKEEIKRLMILKNISFDEARYEYTQQQLSDNGIGIDGTPLDPKTVTFNT